MPKDHDDRTGTVRFVLCDYSIHAGNENFNFYCCTQQDVINSGKYMLTTIRDTNNFIRAAQLGGVLLNEEPLKFSWERQKKKEEMAERVLSPCVDCKFWKIRKEDLSKKVPE